MRKKYKAKKRENKEEALLKIREEEEIFKEKISREVIIVFMKRKKNPNEFYDEHVKVEIPLELINFSICNFIIKNLLKI